MGFLSLPSMSMGWVLDSTIRGAAIMSFIFLTSGILEIANQVSDENGKIEGTNISASTTITLMTTVNNFLTAVGMPIIGAIVDHTTKRWELLFYR